jgi:hypothetical protein
MPYLRVANSATCYGSGSSLITAPSKTSASSRVTTLKPQRDGMLPCARESRSRPSIVARRVVQYDRNTPALGRFHGHAPG